MDSDRSLAAACYVLGIAAFFALSVAPYRDERFVRLHAAQALGYWIAALLLAAFAAVALGFIPSGDTYLAPLLPVALLIVPLVYAAKALRGESAEMPVIYDLVKRYVD